MSSRIIAFEATKVSCSEAGDYEIVHVTFDTMDAGAEETDRTSPYLLLGANFEFNHEVQLEFHDGQDDDGGYGVAEIALWRDRVRVISDGGHKFAITFRLADSAFSELRRFLKILLRMDCFQEN